MGERAGRRLATGYYMTMAPLIVNGKVMVGVSGASSACAASSPPTMPGAASRSGRRTRFRGQGEPGHDTWEGHLGKAAARRSG